MNWKLEITCTQPGVQVQDLEKMYESGKEITYRTALRHLGRSLLESVFPCYIWDNGKGLRMRRDWHVKYYRSRYNGQKCIHIVWSAIDHIFTPEQ